MNNSLIWDATLWSPKSADVSEENQSFAASCWFILCLFFEPEDRGDTFLQNIG
jgi:hypothetical protein